MKIKEIAKEGMFCDGDWIESKDQDPDGKVRLIQLADVGDGSFIDKSARFMNKETAERLKCTYLNKGDILIARMPDPIGRACLFPFNEEGKYVTAVDVAILRLTEEVEKKYVMYGINSDLIRRQIKSQVTGTTRQRITRKKIGEIDLPLPPLDQQKKIAAILDAADAYRQKTKALIAKYDELTQSLFLDMFGDTWLNPKNWDVYKVEDLAIKEKHGIKAGPFGSSLKKEFYVHSGYKIYGQEQVIKDDLSFGDYYIDERKFKELESCKITSGDILISLVGTYGKISVVPDDFEEGIINPRLMKISPNRTLIRPDFLKMLLQSTGVGIQMKNQSRGGTMDIVNVGIMKGIKVPLPPLDLQNQFAESVQAIETQKAQAQASLEKAEELFNSLLQRAFKGELF